MDGCFQPIRGLDNILPPERRVALSQFDVSKETGIAYLRAGLYPAVIGNLNALTRPAIAPQENQARCAFQTGDYLLDFDKADDSILGEAAHILTAEAASLPIRAQLTTLCTDLLRFDRDTFHEQRVSLDFFYNNEDVAPGFTLTQRWHQHLDAKRVYLVRPSIPPEIICDHAVRLDAVAKELMADIPTKHKLPAAEYSAWESKLRQNRLFFQANPYDVVLITGRTWHRSHQPLRQTPSCFLALTIS